MFHASGSHGTERLNAVPAGREGAAPVRQASLSLRLCLFSHWGSSDEPESNLETGGMICKCAVFKTISHVGRWNAHGCAN